LIWKEEIIFENFKNSENKIISVELAKVRGYIVSGVHFESHFVGIQKFQSVILNSMNSIFFPMNGLFCFGGGTPMRALCLGN
jgi:hypothetical protein